MIGARIPLNAEVGSPEQSACMTCSVFTPVPAHQQLIMDLRTTLWFVVRARANQPDTAEHNVLILRKCNSGGSGCFSLIRRRVVAKR